MYVAIYADDRNELNYKSIPNLHSMQTSPVLILNFRKTWLESHEDAGL